MNLNADKLSISVKQMHHNKGQNYFHNTATHDLPTSPSPMLLWTRLQMTNYKLFETTKTDKGTIIEIY